jgi:cytochrome P450
MTPAEYSLASFMLIVAVIDTTSNSLWFTMHLIRNHPEVKERLLKELVRVMPNQNSVVK